jgi:dGTPase
VPVSTDFLRNEFYQEFDTEIFDGPRSSDTRPPFAQDRDRIGHSAAYRRLQAKTQVFRSGEYDFYRTRLTHTNEVALVGRGICEYLWRTSAELTDHFHPDVDLVEACCMAHDIGHLRLGTLVSGVCTV